MIFNSCIQVTKVLPLFVQLMYDGINHFYHRLHMSIILSVFLELLLVLLVLVHMYVNFSIVALAAEQMVI